MYLPGRGSKELLIGCGIGPEDIPAEICKLADTSLSVVVTHSHPKHNGAAAQFQEIYMYSQGVQMSELSYEQPPEFWEHYVRSLILARNPGMNVEEMPDLIQQNGPATRISIENGLF